ncbi:ADA regulatory protein [Arcticibacter svalbardensis MN12-7]|uniref:ADA regulatory protein n=1 Tax=Arcticibacter svalbardensis MN12-7 TaxID=1150600 RepID=R9H4L5_9SPHI|nr:methylated-DNA--[protein]-cysteine S-methyltransferase [Arcticibacter svalbardensis]EOR96109.1 ADA regulatory protein [Arcticibacter svalbardensis MN12-7]
METQNEIDYHRIAQAIEFLRTNYKSQPTLEEAAEHVHISPFHFQRMFKEWAGVTPKQFLQYTSIEHAKSMLQDKKATLFDTAYEIGLSGTSRLHDLFIKLEAMTPGEYKNGGALLSINYSFADSPFGEVIVASTFIGLCCMAFADEGREKALTELQCRFPNAAYNERSDAIQQSALAIFTQDWDKLNAIKLHLKATTFQIKVWEALLKVPMGELITYSGLAGGTNSALACRAVGSAVGSNPVAYLIPCHRVIKSTGELGQYHWGSQRKNMIVGWEASKSISIV